MKVPHEHFCGNSFVKTSRPRTLKLVHAQPCVFEMEASIYPEQPAPGFKAASPPQLIIALKVLNWLGGLPIALDPKSNLLVSSPGSFWRSLIITLLLPGLPTAVAVYIAKREGLTLPMLM